MSTLSRSIFTQGKSLVLSIVAEGVETEAQRQFFLAEGYDIMQGFLFSRPISEDQFSRLLEMNKKTCPLKRTYDSHLKHTAFLCSHALPHNT